jgi:hypothetical protein
LWGERERDRFWSERSPQIKRQTPDDTAIFKPEGQKVVGLQAAELMHALESA